jgi:lipopolysaccharide export LptBFGC system permease protein LptF
MTLLNCYLAWHSVNVALRGEAGIRLVLTRVPQALSLSIPIALTLGLAAALGGRIVSTHVRFRLAALAIACSVMVFCDLAWAVPAANQSFRIRTSRLFAQQRGDVEHWSAPPPGPSEWTLGHYRRELQRERNSSLLPYTSLPWPRFGRDRELEYSYYFRWLFPTASIVLALVILSLVGQRPIRRWLLVAIAFAALFGYYVLLFLARALAVGRELRPIVLTVWSPNVVFLLISIVLMLSSRRRLDRRPASS